MATSPSRKRVADRVRLRIPYLIEIEGEGLTAVVGGILLATLVVLLAYFVT